MGGGGGDGGELPLEGMASIAGVGIGLIRSIDSLAA